jgi:polysaccharide biosynthesis/export protein
MMLLGNPHTGLALVKWGRALRRLTLGLTPNQILCMSVAFALFCAAPTVKLAQQSIAPPASRLAPLGESVSVLDSRLSDVYRISPDDLLDVYVVDVPEYSRVYRVAPNGNIRLPLLDEPIMAAGLTPSELGNTIGKKLTSRDLLHNPQVLVEVKESRSHAIAITGAVNKPQNFEVFSSMTLLNAISQAAGLLPDASNTAVITRGELATRILRTAQAGSDPGSSAEVARTTSVDLKKLMAGVQSENIELYPGDSVTVQRAGIVYVVGAVNRAGGFAMDGQHSAMTVLKAVALAENLKSTADSKKAFIIRKNTAAPSGTDEISINLKRILSNQAPDSPLLAEDVLFVPDSSAKKVLYRTGEAAAQAATMATYGLVIYH